jgi:hypothetical protein
MSADKELVLRARWTGFLESLTQQRKGDPTSIEVTAGSAASYLEANPLPLQYIEYDSRRDNVVVAVDARDGHGPVLRHFIDHPLHIWARPSSTDPAMLDVEDSDGCVTLVTLYRTSASSHSD